MKRPTTSYLFVFLIVLCIEAQTRDDGVNQLPPHLKEAVAGCQQLQLFTAAHAAVGDLNPMGFLSVYDRFTKCFFVLQGTKDKLASLHLIISQLSETSSSQKRAGRYLEARYELGCLLEIIVMRMGLDSPPLPNSPVVCDTQSTNAVAEYNLEIDERLLRDGRPHVHIIHISLPERGRQASWLSLQFRIIASPTFLQRAGNSQTEDGAKSPVMMVGLVVTFTCSCILGVGVWRYCKEKSTHTAEWTNAPRKARVLSHGRSAPYVKQGTGSADTKSKSRLSATMPNHLFKAKDLKKVNKSKMKNNIVLTTEEEEALGYLEEAEQFYNVLKREDSQKSSTLQSGVGKRKNSRYNLKAAIAAHDKHD